MDLNVKPKTTKLLEENIEQNLGGLGLCKVFLVMMTDEWSIKLKKKKIGK